jgi:hypothetical protein
LRPSCRRCRPRTAPVRAGRRGGGKLVTATDPRGHDTKLAYNESKAGDDPAYHWWTKTITDRPNGDTGFVYTADTANTKFVDTTVTDPEAHAAKYVTDDFGDVRHS